MAIVNNNVNVPQEDFSPFGTGLADLGDGLKEGLCCLGAGISGYGGLIASGHTAAAGTLGTAQTTAATIAAQAYQAESTAAWAQRLILQGLIAAAQIALLQKQKDDYDEIAQEQRDLIDDGIEKYCECIEDVEDDIEDAYPGVAQAALYDPVDDCAMQAATISCNLDNTTSADEYARRVNQFHHLAEQARVSFFNTSFMSDLAIYNNGIRELLNGRIPISDVADIVSDVNEQACLRGAIGCTCKETARSLGVSQLQAMEQGRQSFDRGLASINQNVSPVARMVDIRDMMQSPAQRINLALQQAQLIQNSLQNAYNLAVQVPLGRTAKLQARIQKCITLLSTRLSKANLVNTYVPNYATALTPTINQFANALGGTLFSGFGNSNRGGGNDVSFQGGQTGIVYNKEGRPYTNSLSGAYYPLS